MKQRMINQRPDWTFWVPDNVADWDAPDNWERERIASMELLLRPGMVLYDIGAEHGWLSAVYGTFCGHNNMVLVEPSSQFWPNIKSTWFLNGFHRPLGCYAAFASDQIQDDPRSEVWPDVADGPECGAQAYRHLNHHFLGRRVPIVTIDAIANDVLAPNAITVDVEGAELLVMRGAQNTLESVRPIVWISIHPDMMRAEFATDDFELHEWMGSYDYHGQCLAIDHEEHWLFQPIERIG